MYSFILTHIRRPWPDAYGIAAENIEDELENYRFFEGTAQDYAEEFLEDTGMLDPMPEQLRYYFDIEAFARDLVLGGDVIEAEIAGKHFVVWRA